MFNTGEKPYISYMSPGKRTPNCCNSDSGQAVEPMGFADDSYLCNIEILKYSQLYANIVLNVTYGTSNATYRDQIIPGMIINKFA